MLKVENAGAEFEFFVAVVVDDVDDGMGENEIFERVEIVGKGDFVAFFVGFEDGGAEVDHFDVVETKKRSRGKNE